MYNPDEFRGYTIEGLLSAINQHRFIVLEKLSCAMTHVITSLFQQAEREVIRLLMSPDEDTRELGTQMLFINYLDLYNAIIKDEICKSLIDQEISLYVLFNLHECVWNTTGIK